MELYPISDSESSDEYEAVDPYFTATDEYYIQEILFDMKEYFEKIGYPDTLRDTCVEDFINLFTPKYV